SGAVIYEGARVIERRKTLRSVESYRVSVDPIVQPLDDEVSEGHALATLDDDRRCVGEVCEDDRPVKRRQADRRRRLPSDAGGVADDLDRAGALRLSGRECRYLDRLGNSVDPWREVERGDVRPPLARGHVDADLIGEQVFDG